MTHVDTPVPPAQHVSVTQIRTFSIPGEATLAPEVRTALQELGAALDEHRPLQVHNHGLVARVNESPIAASYKEKHYEEQRKRRSATRSRQRSAGWERPSGRSWPAGASPRLGVNVLGSAYEGQLTRLAEAYPKLRTFPDNEGVWLLVKSRIISGLTREAIFCVALPYLSGIGPRAWGFWEEDHHRWWIGPRHSNFHDGSICAFSLDDRAWSEGGDLRTLLDLYSVWALRHLHLEYLGRWPGKQYSLFHGDPRAQAFYRLQECKADELCGCGSETRRYAECCKPLDEGQNFIQLAGYFLRQTSGGFTTRRPPPTIIDYIEGRSALPRMVDAVFGLADRPSDKPTDAREVL